MKHFWTTAAVGALCALTAQAWAAPQTQYLEPVAAKHHLRGAQPASHAGRAHKHAKGASKSARSSKAHRSKGLRRSHRKGASAIRTHHAAAIGAIKSEAAKSVKVGRGETLAAISRKTGVSVEELARFNHLKKPYHLHLGARVKLPARRYYVVKSGDTLYSLARRFDVDEANLSSLNSIGPNRSILSGQKLYLPEGARDTAAREAPETGFERPARHPTYTPFPSPPAPSQEPPAPPAPERAPSGQPAPAQPFASPPTAVPTAPPAVGPSSGAAQPGGRSPIIQTAPPPSSAEIVAAGRGKFTWPVDGALLSGFGPKLDGQRNDGLNIAANTGDPVRAAADGQVVYAGDQVPSFGNLVLVKHDGGWVTAYANMSKILVKPRDQLVQGQQLGVVGQTGSVDRPQLHFEIRYAASPKDKATPIDPTLLLPQR